MRRWWLVACALWPAWSQAPFRVDVQLINVGFSVRDPGGKLVSNLTQDDFEVTEDGQPQKIAFFARSQDVPLNLGLVVDMSGSQSLFIKQHARDLKTFLTEALTTRDQAFLTCFARHPRLVSDFSPSPKYLTEALEGYETLSGRQQSPYPLLGPTEIRPGGTSFYDAIYYATIQMLARVERGRKALIIFSDGEDNTSAHHMMDVIEAAQFHNVLLFCVRYTETRNGELNAHNKQGISVMERIARETGGAEFDAREKGLAHDFRQIGDQLRSSYELAYHSTNPAADDTFHKISIRVKQPGLAVVSKSGYYARPVGQ